MINDQMEKLYIKYHRELYLYAYSLCKDHHLAQDLTSDAFYKAYLSVDEVDYIKFWLFRVCKNLYLDHLKKHRYNSEDNHLIHAIKDDQTPLDKLIISEDKHTLYRLVINLKASYKEILILYYFCDFSVREISSSTKTSEGAVKAMLFRARNKLKQEMEASHEL